MEDDISHSLNELQASRPTSIIVGLLQIQECQEPAVRDYSQTRSLSCLSLCCWESQATEDVLFRVNLPEDDGDFAAVSYVWEDPLYKDEKKGRYSIVSPSGNIRPANVRDSVLDRVRTYLESSCQSVFWIDQECINQRNQRAKNAALHSMDIIYRRSRYPVGLLLTTLTRQREIDLLFALLNGDIVRPSSRSRYLELVGDESEVDGVLKVLFQLTSDSWWSRRWIFQEEYCTAVRMSLLIPHSPHLAKNIYAHRFGEIQGELTVSAVEFRKQATLFCIACLHSQIFPTRRDFWCCRTVLRKVKKYDMLREYGCLMRNIESEFSLSTHIWADLNCRMASVPSDTLAIMANCCSYSIRLDVEALRTMNIQSLSLALLALSLLNGELLRNDIDSPPGTVLDLIKYQSFQEFDPPDDDRHLTFIKRCRLVDVVLYPDGVGSLGYLWHGEYVFRPKCLTLSDVDSDEDFRDFLSQIIDQLPFPYRRLATNIRKYMRGIFPSNISTFGLQKTFNDMARCIVEAVEVGRPLLVARMGGHGRALAIFIANKLDSPSTPVFTACEPADDRTSRARNCFLDKYVSLEVTMEGYREGKARLRTKNWINGLWFADGIAPQRVVFPWPEALVD